MSLKTPADAPAPSDEPGGERSDQKSLLERVLRLLLGLVVLLGIVGFLAHMFRPELESVGRAFVARFGLLGMALGTFLADGFHFPVPPQFYMLMAIAGGGDVWPALGAITAASLVAGTVGYLLARRIGRWRFVARWLERSAPRVEHWGARYAYRTVLLASVTPIAFSMLCYLAGIYRFPKRAFGLLLLLRIPKLLIYYYLVRLGWGIG